MQNRLFISTALLPLGLLIISGCTTGRNQVEFFGIKDHGNDIVFVIDAKGSLIDTHQFVSNELVRAVNSMTSGQRFTVVLRQGKEVFDPLDRLGDFKLWPVRSDSKLAIKAWSRSGIEPKGVRGPILVQAIATAIDLHLQVIFILSDRYDVGGFELSIAEFISQARRAKKLGIRLNTIQFLYNDPLIKLGMKPVGAQMSEITGGRYRFVGPKDIGLE